MRKLRPFRLFIIIIPVWLVSYCHEPRTEMAASAKMLSVRLQDSSLHLVNDVYHYKANELFNGQIKDLWPNGRIKSIQTIIKGKQEGLSETFYPNGTIESKRWYSSGEKDSIHSGWWENGNKKYEYHFKNGLYNGCFTEWYQSGNMIQQLMYEDGKELYGKGWRDNGKLYMNFVMKNGRRYGMNNSNLCYGLKKETVIEK
jgi:antitoxin component YwqK of YwqJK toxin-antitoxin module